MCFFHALGMALGATEATATMTGLSAFSTGVSALGTLMSANAAYQQSAYQQQVARNNAILAEYQAQDAADRGAKEEQALRLKAAQLKGTQIASMAARGLSLDEGSPMDILVGTDYMLESDVRTIKENTAKQQWAYRNQANQYRAQAGNESPFLAASSELLLGGARVADKWYQYKMAKDGKIF